MLCVSVDYAGDAINGLSPVNGRLGSSPPLSHCSVLKLSLGEAVDRAVGSDHGTLSGGGQLC